MAHLDFDRASIDGCVGILSNTFTTPLIPCSIVTFVKKIKIKIHFQRIRIDAQPQDIPVLCIDTLGVGNPQNWVQ